MLVAEVIFAALDAAIEVIDVDEGSHDTCARSLIEAVVVIINVIEDTIFAINVVMPSCPLCEPTRDELKTSALATQKICGHV